MKTLDEIKAILRKEFSRLKRDYRVSELFVFGSFARGEATENSDIDVLVAFEETPDLWTFINLKNHLAELLGAPVDLVEKKSLKPRLSSKILDEAMPI